MCLLNHSTLHWPQPFTLHTASEKPKNKRQIKVNYCQILFLFYFYYSHIHLSHSVLADINSLFKQNHAEVKSNIQIQRYTDIQEINANWKIHYLLKKLLCLHFRYKVK